MNLEGVVAARRSVRAFDDRSVPRSDVERAVALAVQAPAPHHTRPWRFVLLESRGDKERLSAAMGDAWRRDLASDGYEPDSIDKIVGRSHDLLLATPLLAVCCAEMSGAHRYRDERRRLAEWSLFAHSIGAGLQTFMLALTERGIASCWISAPVFCREVVRSTLRLAPDVEPHALILIGYASGTYWPRPRPEPDPSAHILEAPDERGGGR